jgi:hypothetical protein
MSKLNLNGLLYNLSTGRPVTILDTVSVVKYRVRFLNGDTAELTEEQMQAKFTNERPAYRFSIGFGDVEFCTIERGVRVKGSGPYGTMKSLRVLDREEVGELAAHLGRWLYDQDGRTSCEVP